MILNEKCKEKFLEYIYYREDTSQANEDCKKAILYEADKWINRQDERLINALIIEFFDSVGIYIGVYPSTNWSQYLMFEISINDDWIGEEENRQEATIQAIKKANEIYNERIK